MPSAEILTIGTELLLGEIVDTNTQYLARQLREAGLDLYFTSTVGDNVGRIAEAVRHALTRQPHRAATRRMTAAGFHTVQAGRIDHSLSPRRSVRFLAKSSPAATFFVLSRASTKNVLIAPGTSDSRAASRPECVRHGGNTVCTKWRQCGEQRGNIVLNMAAALWRHVGHRVATRWR